MPVALIDVTDLAAWIVHCMEHQVMGVFNAVGPAHTLNDVYELSPIPVREVPTDALLSAGINQWFGPTSLPLWLADPNLQYAMVFDSTAARNHGLTTRPLAETLQAAAQTFQPGTSGLTDEEERRATRLPHGVDKRISTQRTTSCAAFPQPGTPAPGTAAY